MADYGTTEEKAAEWQPTVYNHFTIARLRREAEARATRAMVNQHEQERKAAEQALRQKMVLLDEFEDWLYGRKFGCGERNYDDEDE